MKRIHSVRYIRQCFFVLFLMGLNVAHPALAGEIWIAPWGKVSGASGSKENPFRSLNAAASANRIVAGTQVYLRGGTYYVESPQLLQLYGTSDRPITITAALGERPVLDASSMARHARYDWVNAVLMVHASTHVTVSGLHIRNAHWGVGLKMELGHHVRFENNTVENVGKNAILVNGGRNAAVVGNTVRDAAMMFRNSTLEGGWPNAVTITAHRTNRVRSTDVLVKGNNVSRVWGEGIVAMFSDRVQFVDNVVSDAFSVGYYVDHSSNMVIRNNIAYANNAEFYRDGKPMVGISFTNENYCCNLNQLNTTRNIDIVNNLLVGVRVGVRHYAYRWYNSPSELRAQNTYRNVNIVNNTIVNYIDYGIDIDADPAESASPYNNTVYNNIVYSAMGARAPIQIHTNNDPWNYPNAVAGWDVSHNNFAGWAPTYASHRNLRERPSFVGSIWNKIPDPDNFKPLSDSPVVGQGLALSGVRTDYFGQTRSNQPSIGFAEVEAPAANNVVADGDANAGVPCGEPYWNAGSDRALIVWRDCGNVIHVVGASGGRSAADYIGRITSSGGFRNVSTRNLETDRGDLVRVSGDVLEFDLSLGGVWTDEFSFQVSSGARVCLALGSSSDGTRVLAGVDRTTMNGAFDPVTLKSCDPGDAGTTSMTSDSNSSASTAGGYVFKRSDTATEYRWIENGASIWISPSCAAQLGGATVVGDWNRLMQLAPRFDQATRPANCY